MIRCVVALLAAATVYGQEVLTVRDAVERAYRANGLVTAAEQRVAAAEGQLRQAGLRPNPRLFLQQENLHSTRDLNIPFWTLTDTFAFLQQPVEASGRRRSRMELAGTEAERARMELDLSRRQLGYRVKVAYWQAAGAYQLLDLWRENTRTFRRVVEYHEIRVREGAMAEADLLRVQLEAERIELAANNAELEARRAGILLLREMGESAFPDLRFADALDPGDDVVKLDEAAALEARPEARLARQSLEVSRAALRLQQNLVRPGYDVLFGYKRTAGLNTVMGGLQVDLPVWNRNQGNVEAGNAEVRVARANLAATEALIRAEVTAVAAENQARRRQVRDALVRLKSQSAETSRIAQAAYREGGADLLRLLDAERTRIDTELLALRALMEYRLSAVALEAAMGVAP